jgi:FdhE protein
MSGSARHQLFLTHIQEAKGRYPELTELLVFYEQLFRTYDAFIEKLDIQPRLVQRELQRSRLSQGIPQFTFEELLIADEDFVRLSVGMSEIITQHMPHHMHGRNGVVKEALLKRAHTLFESGNPVITSSTPPDRTALIAGLALVPFLQRACSAMLPRIPQDAWQRPYCPICGGKPSFAELDKESGARSLLCSRCSAEWMYGRVGCAFCEGTEKHMYYQSMDGLYRLYVCDRCNRYLKTIDRRQTDRDVHLPVECIVTVSMDIAAQQKGYRHY